MVRLVRPIPNAIASMPPVGIVPVRILGPDEMAETANDPAARLLRETGLAPEQAARLDPADLRAIAAAKTRLTLKAEGISL